jgi:hypothetical protein
MMVAGNAAIMVNWEKKMVQSAFGTLGDQIKQPFFCRSNIFGSDRGAQPALPHRGISNSVRGTKPPQFSHP